MSPGADVGHERRRESAGPTIAFYISGHGFGHASRQVEIINALTKRAPGVRILLRTAAARWLLERTLNAPFTLIDRPCDTGVVQIDSLRLDEAATMAVAGEFYSSFDERIAVEARLLREHGVSLVISDAPPLACAAAAAARVPCLVVANFTWDWIYTPYALPGSDPASAQNRHTLGSELNRRQVPNLLANAGPQAASGPTPDARTPEGSDPGSAQNRHTWGSELVRRLADAYARADGAWRLPLHGGFESIIHITDVPFVARHARPEPVETRAMLGLPADRRVALSSFGGYGLNDLDLHRLDCLDAWTVVVTGDRAPRDLPREIYFIEDALVYARGLRYEDLVHAVDVVVTKPGYGIVSECIANDTAIVYTTRGRFREYDVLVGGIQRYLRSAFIHQTDLREGRWLAGLDAAVAGPTPVERPRTDGAEVVADMITARVGASA